MNHDTYLEKRIPEFIDEINGTSYGKFGKPCNIRDYKNLSHFPVYFIYQFPISNEARQEMIQLSIDRRMPIYTTLSSETKDKRKIFVEMNKFIPVIKILNKKFEDYEFYILYSITPSLPANNKSIYIAVKSKSAVSFYNAKEEYNMYNDELDYVLESAYEDGYYQALADMGYEFDDEASEDVDIFDEDYFDEAVEGSRARYDSEGKPLNTKARKNEALVRQNRIDRGVRTDYPTTSGDRKLARQMNPYKPLRKEIYGKTKHEPGNREMYDRGTHYLNNDPDRDAFQGSPSARYRAYSKIKRNHGDIYVRDLKS